MNEFKITELAAAHRWAGATVDPVVAWGRGRSGDGGSCVAEATAREGVGVGGASVPPADRGERRALLNVHK